MSLIKNKSTLFAVMRKDSDRGQDIVCCFTKTIDGAERLCNEYEQQWKDGGGGDEAHYYPVGNIFYDE